MDLERHIRRVFGLRRTHPAPQTAVSEETLAHLGYPELWLRHIFFNGPQRQTWRAQRRLDLPRCCCACGGPAAVDLPCRQRARWWQRETVVLSGVPHCGKHATGRSARLVALPLELDLEVLTGLTLVSESKEFLDKVERLSRERDVLPPWEVFPTYCPETGGWRQGNGEFWWHSVWMPFWSTLSASEREEYLTRWPPPEGWRDRLLLVG